MVPGRQHDEGDLGDDDNHDGDGKTVAQVYDNDDDYGDKAAAFGHDSDDEADSVNDDVGNEDI